MLLFGSHIGGGEDISEEIIEKLVQKVESVQVFVTSPMSGVMPVLNDLSRSRWDLLNSKFEVIIHAPYWASLCDEGGFEKHLKYISILSRDYKIDGKSLRYVFHTGVFPKEFTSWESFCLMKEHAELLVQAAGGMLICVENTAGYKTRRTVSVSDLLELKEKVAGFGITWDSQHAFAAGEDIEIQDLSKFDVIHLNAVPKYTKKGGHLDRHSHTSLQESKPEIQGVIKNLKVLRDLKEGIPVIMERRDLSIALSDISYIIASLDEKKE